MPLKHTVADGAIGAVDCMDVLLAGAPMQRQLVDFGRAKIIWFADSFAIGQRASVLALAGSRCIHSTNSRWTVIAAMVRWRRPLLADGICLSNRNDGHRCDGSDVHGVHACVCQRHTAAE